MMDLLERAEFVKKLRETASSLGTKGADVKNIIGQLKLNQTSHTLLAMRSNIDSLELLSRIHKLEDNHKYEEGGDHTFKEDNITYEVKTITWELDEFKKLNSIILFLTKKYATPNTFTQVNYGERPIVVQSTYTQQLNSDITLNRASEILVSTIPYYKGFLRKTQKRIKEAKSQILKKEKSYTYRRKVVILDMRDLPFGLEFIAKGIKKWLKEKIVALDGVLLLVYDSPQKNSFIVIPNLASQNPIHPNDYEEVRSKKPLTSEWSFSLPIHFKVNKVGEYCIISRTSDGTLYFGDVELGASLLAGETVAFTGYLGCLANISRIKFFKNERLVSETYIFR